MKIAAVNFKASFADVASNLDLVSEYVKQAASEKSELILFPEFFTSSMGFSSVMLEVPIMGIQVEKFLTELSKQYNIIIGGSYLVFDGTGSYNLFQLVFPDGKLFSHKKDIPTITENCYSVNGDCNHIIETPVGTIGIALCWEMIRYDTVRRLSGQVDLVLAGTCWVDLPLGAPLKQYNRDFAYKTPANFSNLLKVPIIHSNHCGTITTHDFPDDKTVHDLQMIGATQIIGQAGNIISEKKFDEGEGIIYADINIGNSNCNKVVADTEKYWIEELPEPYQYAWNNYNQLAREYYNSMVKPYLKKRYNQINNRVTEK